MPDGDRNHDVVAYHFKKAFLKACEGTLTAEDISSSLVVGLQVYGNAPIQVIVRFLHQVQDELAVVNHWSRIDIFEFSHGVGEISAMQLGNKRGLALAVDSCREWLQQSHDQDHNLELSMFRTYIQRMYVADMVESTPLSVLHMDKDPQEVERLLEQLNPEIQYEITRIAVQLVNKKSVDQLRKPPIKHKKINALEDDIYSIGGKVSKHG